MLKYTFYRTCAQLTDILHYHIFGGWGCWGSSAASHTFVIFCRLRMLTLKTGAMGFFSLKPFR